MAGVDVEQRISYAPTFHVVREPSANDAALPTQKSAGLNCDEFDEVVVMVTVTGAVTAATIEPHFWAGAKNGTPNGGFVPEATPQTISVTAAGVRKVLRVAHHDSVFFELTGLTGAGTVRIEVAGVPVFERRG